MISRWCLVVNWSSVGFCAFEHYFAELFASAAARARNFAMVAWEGSFRLPLLLRRFVLVT